MHSPRSFGMTSVDPIRVLHDAPLAGTVNMARDEALMLRVGDGVSPSTLRLYQWESPTISLGYFQHYSDYAALPPPAGRLAVVRRLTGGGAILHDLELTYSLTLPAGHRLLSHGAGRLYEVAHDAVIEALTSLGIRGTRCGATDDSTPTRGPFFCFSRRHSFDVLVGAAKIAGSAQRRTRTGVLQHGSIILANRFDQQTSARPELAFADGIHHLRTVLVGHLAQFTGETFAADGWSPAELHAVEPLIEKYAGDEWTKRT